MPRRKSNGVPTLPAKQLAILAICRFAEPVALTSVFPYLPEMIESFGIDKKNVAKWAGITSAAFSLSQCLTAVIWGRISDKFGRKPSIVLGLTCLMCSTLFWGMSTSLPMAITARAFAGAFNGNVGIIRTMVAEMVPEKELQPRAFSLMPLVWSLGSIFGPSFGGFFAKPAENLSGLFGNNKFLIKYPFALPNIVASGLFLVGICTGILFLQETLETKRDKKDYGLILGSKLTAFIKNIFRLNREPKPYRWLSSSYDESSASLLPPTSSSSSSYPTKPKPVLPRPSLREVFTRQSVINLITYTFAALHCVAYDQLLPIFLHNPQQKHNSSNTTLPLKFGGGFGMKSSRIGTIFTLYGICGCFIQFLVFPPVAKKFGVLNCFKVCGLTFPIICFITPYTALIENSAWQQASLIPLLFIRSCLVIFTFPCSIILLTNSASSMRILGTLNGVAVSISAIGRAAGPAMSGATFTWGLERGYVIPAWWLLGVIAAIGAIPIWWQKEGEGFGDTDDEEEEESLLPTVDEEEDGRILGGDEIDRARNKDDEGLEIVNGPPLSGSGLTQVSEERVRERGDTASSGSRKWEDDNDDEGGNGIERLNRRMSSPIGFSESIGPGGGRRLTNGLAASNLGQGTGGTSFT